MVLNSDIYMIVNFSAYFEWRQNTDEPYHTNADLIKAHQQCFVGLRPIIYVVYISSYHRYIYIYMIGLSLEKIIIYHRVDQRNVYMCLLGSISDKTGTIHTEIYFISDSLFSSVYQKKIDNKKFT